MSALDEHQDVSVADRIEINGVQIKGDDRVIILIALGSGDVIGSAYAIDAEPGWWRGIGVDGRLRSLWVAPGATEPHLTVARRLT